MGDTRTRKYEFLIVLDMKQDNNEQIVFDMFEEVATESIAEARNVYTYEEIDGCYLEAKEIVRVVKDKLEYFKNIVE